MTENNDFNNTENEKRYCVRAGYWHNYTGIGRCEDENLTTNEVCDLINEQNETIQCHKERIAILSELLDFADAIIDLSDNEKAKNTWANKNTQLNIEWKKVLLKYGV